VSISIDLLGKRILVVGGSAGIGRGIALAAGKAGAAIAVVGRRAERLHDVVKTVGSGTAIAADIRDAGACSRLVDDAVAALGALDAVVFATGVSILAPLDEVDPQVWHDIVTTNTIAPALITKAALPALAPGGVVIFLSSITVGGGHHGLGVYAASKAALDRTVRSWRLERPDKRFVCMAVGDTVGTEFARNFDPAKAMALAPKWVAAGVIYQQRMEAEDLGLGITEILALLLAHPGLTIPELTVVPPGPMLSGGVEDMGRQLAEAQAALEPAATPGPRRS
jgi:NAD(P)-dependent dehydrogenase (short-subunit alcohol dehydrogenase family)